jgi:hypothetical protein
MATQNTYNLSGSRPIAFDETPSWLQTGSGGQVGPITVSTTITPTNPKTATIGKTASSFATTIYTENVRGNFKSITINFLLAWKDSVTNSTPSFDPFVSFLGDATSGNVFGTAVGSSCRFDFNIQNPIVISTTVSTTVYTTKQALCSYTFPLPKQYTAGTPLTINVQAPASALNNIVITISNLNIIYF